MKKQLLLIGLLFTMFVAFSQTTETKSESQPTATADAAAEPQDDFCPHRLWLHFGAGYASNTFKEIKKISKRNSYFAMAEFGYTYFFHRNVGIGIGVGINQTAAIAKINDRATLIDLVDPVYFGTDPYNLTFTTHDLKEKQRVWAIEVPLSLQFEKKWNKNGIYAGVGVKGYFPFSSRVGFTEGQLVINKIEDPKGLNITYDDLFRWMENVDIKDRSVKPKMRCSVDVIADFGGVFGISRAADFYIGAYGSYGFLNILPKDGVDLSALNVGDFRLGDVANHYVNSTKKWNLWQVGVKLGFHFKVCKNCQNDEYMKDTKRKYMEEMLKKNNEPVIVTNTVQEYYYFVPTVSPEVMEEAEKDPVKKKDLLELAETLANIKILFDLDKDIPKLDDYKREQIKKAANILKANPTLKVIISGYTSPEGSKEHNKDLGNRRANAVRKIFIEQHGVPVDQITTQNFTAEDEQHKLDIPEKEYTEQRAVIFRIEKR